MKFLVGVKGKEFVFNEEMFNSVEEFLRTLNKGDWSNAWVIGRSVVLGVEIGLETYIRIENIDYITVFEDRNMGN